MCCRTAWEEMPGLRSLCAARPAATMLLRRCHPCDLGRAPRALSTHCRHDTLAASAISEIQWILKPRENADMQDRASARVILKGLPCTSTECISNKHLPAQEHRCKSTLSSFVVSSCSLGCRRLCAGNTVACKLAFVAPCAADYVEAFPLRRLSLSMIRFHHVRQQACLSAPS